MYPETPIVLNNPNESRSKLRMIVLGALAVVVLFIAGLVMHARTATPAQGTINIQYSPETVDSLAIKLNGKIQTLKLSPATYKVTAGSYTLKLTAPGYKDFSATVPVTAGQTVLINAQLKLADVKPITTSDQIVLPEEVSSVQILSTQYFYNKTWALLHVNTADDSDVLLILQLDPSTGDWETVDGPAVGVDPVTLGNLPALIQQYITDNGYAVDGD
jgi:hypothetical protein